MGVEKRGETRLTRRVRGSTEGKTDAGQGDEERKTKSDDMTEGKNDAPPFYISYEADEDDSENLFCICSGLLGGSVYSLMYVVTPALLFSTIMFIFIHLLRCLAAGTLVLLPSTPTLVLLSISLATTLCPPILLPQVLSAWPFKHLPAYFRYMEIRERTLEETQKTLSTRQILGCCHPHGVFSYGGLCSAIVGLKQGWYKPAAMPLAGT